MAMPLDPGLIQAPPAARAVTCTGVRGRPVVVWIILSVDIRVQTVQRCKEGILSHCILAFESSSSRAPAPGLVAER